MPCNSEMLENGQVDNSMAYYDGVKASHCPSSTFNLRYASNLFVVAVELEGRIGGESVRTIRRK